MIPAIGGIAGLFVGKSHFCDASIKTWLLFCGFVAYFSLAFLTYYAMKQLRKKFYMKWAFNVTMGIEGAYFLMTIWGLVAVSNLDASCDEKKQADYMLDIVILIIVRAFRLWFVMVYCALFSPFLIYRWYKTRPRPTESPKKLIKAFCCVT